MATAFASGTEPREAAMQRAGRKADMIFLEALRHKEAGDPDAYAELVARAFEINPSDPYLGFEHGRLLMAVEPDSTARDSGYALIRRYAVEGEGRNDYTTVMMALQAAARSTNYDDMLLVLGRLYRDYPERPDLADRYAQALVAADDSASFDLGMAVYDTLEMREGPSVTLAVRRYSAYLSREDSASALRQVHRLVEAFPVSAEASVVAGDLLHFLGMPDSALARYNRAIELDPANGQAYYSRANLLLEQGDSAAYNREIFLALEQPDLDLDTKTELMRDYVVKLMRDPAQRPRIDALFNRLIESHPHEAAIHGLYADYLATTGDYGRAAEQVQYELDLDPADINRWRMLASLYYNDEDFARAEAAVDRALTLFPDDPDLPLLAAAVLSDAGKTREALDVIARAVADAGDDAMRKSSLMTSRGDILYKAGQLDSAFTAYDTAIALDPTNYLAMNNAAYFLACSDRDLDRALSLIETANLGRPDDPTTLDTFAWVMFKRGDYSRARELIDRTLTLSNEKGETITAELLEHAGDIYFMVREPEKALEFWSEALELDPENDLLRRKVKNKTYFYE